MRGAVDGFGPAQSTAWWECSVLKSWLAWGCVIALALLAFALREGARASHRAQPTELAPEWAIDDPDAAYHLRRTSLTLHSGRVPGSDRFLNHPAGSPIPWPPLADAIFAGIARATGALHGEGPMRVVNEARLEGVLVHVPPVLGALTVLGVAAAVLIFMRPEKARWRWVLLAAAAYALSPAAIWYGGVTRIDHHVLVALGLALSSGLLAWALSAREQVDITTAALLSGLTSGALLLMWLASAVFLLPAGLALLVRAASKDSKLSSEGARAGILFFAAAAVVTLLPASQSDWNALEPGSLVNLTEGVPRALFAACLPFAVFIPEGVQRSIKLVLAPLAALAAVLLLPGFLDGVRAGLDWASRENLFMDVVGESRPLESAADWLRDLSPLAFALPLALVAILLRARRDPASLYLFLLCVLMAIMTFTQRRFANTLAVPMACGLAVGLAEWERMLSARGTWRHLPLGLALALTAWAVPAALAQARTNEAEAQDLLEWRRELIGGLRWMRTGTPSPGAWMRPESPQDYGVLASWGMGHLIEYHARRPTIATNFGSFVGERNFAAAAGAMLETEQGKFAKSARGLGARYLVATPRNVGELVSFARIAGRSSASLFERRGGKKVFGPGAQKSLVWRAALHDREVGDRSLPGFELVYRSDRVETPGGTRPRAGEPFGPVISIYRIAAAPVLGEAGMGAPPSTR